MRWNLITASEIQHLPLPERFFAYANAYRNAAASLCAQMNANVELATWPNAAVVLMLSAHAVELFIKGAILSKDSAANIEHHRIDELAQVYKNVFPEPEYNWEIPFRVDCSSFDDAQIELLRKQIPVPSVLYRYPVGKGWSEWNGAFGFEPSTFASVLDTMKSDFGRIAARMV